ncbi:MAG: CBS domain-containing protein [Anaerolineales bacterium]|nr:CBS domain-containing protein [Anaerolineales bacterium]
MKGNLVRDWMTPDPITVTSNVAIPEAYWIMVNNKIRRLPVVDDGILVGIITLEDLRQKFPFTSFAIDVVRASDILSNYPIGKIMSQNPRTTTPDTTLAEAAKLMIERGISTLPVMESGKLVGIITESIIFRAFVELTQRTEMSERKS